MNTPGKEELIQIARTYYPRGDSTAPDAPRSSERLAWEEAWNRAMRWKECDSLIQELQTTFPKARAARFMQPRRAACVYCVLLLESRDHDGARHLTRIVGALSVLAPVYLIYVTQESMGSAQPSPRPLANFSPEGPEKAYAGILAQLIEQHLGYRPFPLDLAHVPLSDVHVEFLHSEHPTLLTAFFANHLEDLP